MTQQTSTAVKAAALILVAPALLFPIKAAGQQVAATGAPRNVAECNSLSTPGERVECTIRLGGQENRKAAAAAEREVSCGDDIKAGIGAGTFKRARLKEILAGRPAADVGLCRILAQLKS